MTVCQSQLLRCCHSCGNAIFALDDAVVNEINIVLDEELLSPEVTSLDTINHIVLKITEVMKNSGLSRGLLRDNTRRKNKHKRKTKQCLVHGRM